MENWLIKKILSLIITSIIFLNSVGFVFAETPEQVRKAIRDAWLRGEYSNVSSAARDYYNGIKKRADVAYWLATSLCRTGDKPRGIDLLIQIKFVAKKPNILEALDAEISNCRLLNPPRSFPSQGFVGSLGSLKQMEFPGSLATTVPLGTFLIESNDSIDERALARRILNKNDKSQAISSVKRSLTYTDTFDGDLSDKDFTEEKRLLREKFKNYYDQEAVQSLQVGGSFIFTCINCQKHTASDLDKIGLGLEKYINFFKNEFGMKQPDVFIKIYAATNNSDFDNLAQQLHGVSVGPFVMGYSIADDMSMVVTLPWWDTKLYGTTKHELFHLMIGSDFGDAPPWIEEGMATLYEGSEIKEGKVIGVQNWRENILRKNLNTRPSIKKLIDMNWMVFNYVDEPDKRPEQDSKTSVLHATARYFILYLEKKEKLAEIYKKMRETKIDDSFRLIKPDAKTVLEESLGMSIDKIDKDFIDWFKKLSDITSTSNKTNNPKVKKFKSRRKKR